MAGAVAGPLAASALLFLGVAFRDILLWTLIPGLLAAGAMFFMTRERAGTAAAREDGPSAAARPSFPRAFWLFLIGVALFGLGDFSRTFLIWLAARDLGGASPAADQVTGLGSAAALLYLLHNLVSASAAYPVGHLGDRRSRYAVLLWGYGLGVATNGLLAAASGRLGWLVVVIVLSGVYIAVEETLEKAVAAEILPRELWSLGFGILACANAAGDLLSSLYVGALLQAGAAGWAFGLAAAFGFIGTGWLAVVGRTAKATNAARPV